MKEGWEYKKLGEVCGKCSNIKWDDVSNEASYRYIDLTSVDRGDLHIHNPQNIRKDNAPSRAKQIIKAGDVIFATTRPTLRRISIIEEQYDGDICSTGFCVLRHNEVVKSRFVFYALLYDGFYKYIEPLQTGANYPAVTDNVVKNYIIPVPPLPEQQRIVDYLDSAFAKIDAMKANAEKSLNEAKALFQASLKEMLEPKEGWEEKRIDEVSSIARGGSPRPIKDYITNDPNGLNWIKIGDTDMGGKYIYSTKEKIKPEGLKKSRWVEEDEFLLSNSMSFGRPYILKTNGCIHDGWLVLRDYQKYLDIDFFYYVLSSEFVQKQFRTKAQGSTVSNLNTDRVASVTIPVPPLSEQQRIVATLDSLKSKVDRLQANFEKISQECDALKQSILRQVFE